MGWMPRKKERCNQIFVILVWKRKDNMNRDPEKSKGVLQTIDLKAGVFVSWKLWQTMIIQAGDLSFYFEYWHF